MVSHHPANFGGHRHCGSGDMILIVVEGQIPHALSQIRNHCSSVKHMACHTHTCEIS